MEGRKIIFSAALLVQVVLFNLATDDQNQVKAKPLFPAVIGFGDSIIDPGNNDVLITPIQCNFPPYGQDFAGQQATGRFSNGKIPTDFMVSGVGIKELLPPYLGVELQPEDLLTGVSFASGGTGFDPLTPQILNVIPLTKQLDLFQEYKEKLNGIASPEQVTYIVSGSLYIVCAGTDDIANTYFSTPFRQLHYDINSYVNLLISGATDFLKQLNALGARKIGFVGLPPVGCVPSQRTTGGGISRACEPKRNYAAQLFNSKIQNVINKLNGELPNTKIVYFDIYSTLLDLIQRPYRHGFQEATRGCCGTGTIEGAYLCNQYTTTVCDDVTKYVFWDSYHPTERAAKIIVDSIFQRYLRYLV